MREAITINPEGTTTVVVPENLSHFKLHELYRHTDSEMVQVIELKDGRQMWLDEDGKAKMKEINPRATRLAESVLFPSDVIVGTVLVCSKGMVK